MTDAGDSSSQALDWVKGELDETLKQATRSLEFFVENTDDDYELGNCADALQQVGGTLRIVDIPGAVRFTEQMLALARGLQEGRVERSETAYEALMRGLLQLPAYLEYLHSGGRDLPEALLPDLNELRRINGEQPLDPAALFEPSLDALPADMGTLDRAPQELAAKVRGTFQKALRIWVVRRDDPNAIRVLLRVGELLRQGTHDGAVSRLWWAASGLFEAMGHDALVVDRDLRRLLTELDGQLKRLAETGEEGCDQQGVRELTRAVLYRLAQVAADSPLLAALHDAFGLAGSVPTAEELEAAVQRMHGPDAAVLRSVAESVKEDYDRIRDIIEIFGASNDSRGEDLGPLLDHLGRISDTLGMMALHPLSTAIRAQRERVAAMVAGDLEATERNVVDVAEVLLHSEAYLAEMIQGSGHALRVTDLIAPLPEVGARSPGVAQSRMTDLERRRVDRALYKISGDEVGQIRAAIAAQVTGEEAEFDLDDMAPRLLVLAGALHCVGRSRPAVLLGMLSGFLDQAQHDGFDTLGSARLETLADVITALESALEAFGKEQPADLFLAAAEERIGGLVDPGTAGFETGDPDTLTLAPGEEEGLTVAAAETPADDAIAPEAVDLSAIAALEEAPLEESVAVAGTAAVGAADEGEFPVLSDDFDPETLEIFLEEADEVVGNLAEWLPAWRGDPTGEAVLADIRRAFHTLKGSGRLVGALQMGEFAWAFENLLNRVIEGSREATPEVTELVGRGVELLPAMVEQLRGGASPGAVIAALMGAADAQSRGEAMALPERELAVPKGEEQGEPEVVETVQPVPEEPGAAAVASTDDEVVPEFPVLSDDFDPETLEIFLEEADEVVGNLAEWLPAWRGDPTGEAVLADIRRAFHTLKGSGRLVGALQMGEYAWAFENLLNRVIEGSREATPEVTELVGRGVELLPAMVEQLRGGASPGAAIAALMGAADALASGEDVTLPVVESAATGADDAQQATEVDAAEEAGTAPVLLGMDPVLFGIYQRECSGHLATLSAFVEQSRQSGPLPPSDDLLRALHTLRGSSSMAEAQSITQVATRLETLCKARRASGAPVSPNDESLIEHAVTTIGGLLGGLEQPSAEPPAIDELLERFGHPEEAALAADNAAVAMADGEPSHDLLVAGADFLQSLEDAVSRWVTASADVGPLEALGGPARALVEDAHGGGFPAVAALVEALSGLLGSIVAGHLAADADVLDLLDRAADRLTQMFDNLAVLRPAEADPGLVAELLELAARPPQAMPPEASPPAAAATPAASAWELGDDVDPDLLDIFLDEGSELLDEAEATIHRWEGDVHDREAIALLQRQLHTLKGGSRMAGIAPMGDLSHASESLLSGVVDGRLEPSATLFEALNSAVDHLVGMLDAIRERQPLDTGIELIEDLHDLAAGTVHEIAPEVDDGTVWEPGEEVDQEIVELFLEEGGELLDEAAATVHRWQEDVNDREAIALLQRQLHTLKGGSRMAGIAPMGDLSHASESLLTGVVEGRLEPTSILFETLNSAVDRLVGMLEAVRDKEPLAHARDLQELLVSLGEGRTPSLVDAESPIGIPRPVEPPKTWDPAQPAPEDEAPSAGKSVARPAAAKQEQVRVRAELLNGLVNLAGEVSIYRARLEQQNNVLRFNLVELEQTVVRLREQLRKLEIETDAQIHFTLEAEGRTLDDFDPLEMDRYTALQTLSRSLLESLDDLTNIRELMADQSRVSDTLLLQQSRANTELQQGLMQARMMPFSRLVPRMRRIVRQTSQEMGKKVSLWVQGEQSDVDSAVINRIAAPLEHLIRNSIAHGIETPKARRQAGKDETGKITLTVDREGSDIVFRIKDDGAGIDAEKVRRKAIERGLLKADAKVSEHDVLQYIFESGVSTADQVTQVSGRGVGMDVVISETKQLGGSVEINSKPGHGASFYIRLPFTLAVNRALLVTVGDDLFAIPLTSIEGIVRLRADELQAYYDGDKTHYSHAGSDYLVRDLGSLLGIGRAQLEEGLERIPVLLVRSGEQGVALHVDGLVGSREIVVKSLGPQLSTVRGLFGATILVDGRVALILDTAALVRMGALQETVATDVVEEEVVEEAPRQTLVMIVDDSITVRRVTSRLLERNGFAVVTAKDGIDAINVLQESVPDIMLLDIEMPRMDGFELAQHIRGDSELSALPIIMITSRTGDKHVKRGMAIGVNRMLGKPYQDTELLENIRELIGDEETSDA